VLAVRAVTLTTLRQAGRFNLRRDWNSLLSLTGRHLVWPAPVLQRLRAFLRCAARATSTGAATRRWRRCLHGTPRRLARPYEEGTLFFYIDEYIKDAPKDLLACWPPPRLADRSG
jgi:hypothetical protein